MSIEGLIGTVILLVISLLFIGYPFTKRSKKLSEKTISLEKQRERLLVYYEQVLSTIRDLDEDLSTGKIPENDYHQEREMWATRGVQVLQAIQELDDSGQYIVSEELDKHVSNADIDKKLDDAIEDAISKRIQAAREQL